MQKRKLIILIIIVAAVIAGIFIYLYFSAPVAPAGDARRPVFNFFPFNTAKKTVPQTPADNSNTGTEIPNYEVPAPEVLKLKKVSSFPIAGYGMFAKEVFKEVALPTIVGTPTKVGATPPATEFVTTLRYVERATGNVYQTRADQIDERKFTGTIIPKIHEAFFGTKSTSVIMRYLKGNTSTIQTFVGSLPVDVLGGDSAQISEIKGNFLPENITDLSISPDGSRIFYLFNANDSAVGITANALGGSKAEVLSSSYTEWLSQWPNARMITLSTKPSAGVPGYMYAIDPDKKDFNKILGNINGLSTLTAPSGRAILYSSSEINGSLTLSIYSSETGRSNRLGVKTLPEKCVWTRASDFIYCAVPKFIDAGAYPDVWYQGLVSFSDEIWKIDAQSGSAVKISDPVQMEGDDTDGIKLSLDQDEKYIFYVNKKDSYLWELAIK